MKKLLFVFAALLGVFVAGAQIKTPSLTDFVKPPVYTNADSVSKGVLTTLTSQLGLSTAQQTKAAAPILGFLTEKQGILGLATSNAASYVSKFKPLQSGLFTKLKGILTVAQYTKFLGLKPSGSGVGNILSNLFN